MATMGTEERRAPEAIVRLRAVLESIAGALASGRLDALLAGDGELEGALASLPSMLVVEPASKMSAIEELQAARAALVRCRRLGTTLSDVVRITLSAQGVTGGYGRHGEHAPTPGARSFEQRI